MVTRKRHPTLRTGELPLPIATPPRTTDDARPVASTTGAASSVTVEHAGATVELAPGQSVSFTMHQSQLDRANALARAREEGDREATIAAMAECAAMAAHMNDGILAMVESGHSSDDAAACILAELHRRFPNDERVRYHLELRGLLERKP